MILFTMGLITGVTVGFTATFLEFCTIEILDTFRRNK